MNEAETCRMNGWGVGTRLVGDEGYGPTVIRITAIGESRILAVCESHPGKPQCGKEGTWVLWCRDWKVADDLISFTADMEGRDR